MITKDLPPLDCPRISSLPVIRVAPYLSDDGRGRLSVSAALHAACKEFGFFYLDLTGFATLEEMGDLGRLAREFFALPIEDKDRIRSGLQGNVRGYQRPGGEDNYEGLYFCKPAPNLDEKDRLCGENQWPSVPGFRERYEKWIGKMKELGLIIMKAMAAGLGLTPEEWEELKGSVDDSFWVMRVMGYPPVSGDCDQISMGSHKDYGCLRFLWANETQGDFQVFLQQPGLIVKAPFPYRGDGTIDEVVEQGTWINADPLRGCILCNIGEMWEIWSNGLYKTPLHRDVHQSGNYRISVPFSIEPNFGALVKPLNAALRMEAEDSNFLHPREDKVTKANYEPVRYGEGLMRRGECA